jgi:hypothetical protein
LAGRFVFKMFTIARGLRFLFLVSLQVVVKVEAKEVSCLKTARDWAFATYANRISQQTKVRYEKVKPRGYFQCLDNYVVCREVRYYVSSTVDKALMNCGPEVEIFEFDFVVLQDPVTREHFCHPIRLSDSVRTCVFPKFQVADGSPAEHPGGGLRSMDFQNADKNQRRISRTSNQEIEVTPPQSENPHLVRDSDAAPKVEDLRQKSYEQFQINHPSNGNGTSEPEDTSDPEDDRPER